MPERRDALEPSHRRQGAQERGLGASMGWPIEVLTGALRLAYIFGVAHVHYREDLM